MRYIIQNSQLLGCVAVLFKENNKTNFNLKNLIALRWGIDEILRGYGSQLDCDEFLKVTVKQYPSYFKVTSSYNIEIYEDITLDEYKDFFTRSLSTDIYHIIHSSLETALKKGLI